MASTNRVEGGGVAPTRAPAELIEFRPGETRAYNLELGALDGNGAIDRFAVRVAAPTTGEEP